MSSRSRGARDLAYHLSDKVGIPVRISWEKPPGRPGEWLVEWHDGPTVATMRGHADDLVRCCRPLTITMLRFSRFPSDQAQATAMLALAHRGELPERAAIACMVAERELADTDTAVWAHLWAHAGQLVEQAGGDLYEVVTLVHATVTKPRDEPPPHAAHQARTSATKPRDETLADPTAPATCQHCGAPQPAATTGRPARYCGPTCRQAAHRARQDVTKPRHETICAVCGRVFTPTGGGRPALHCSPACRSRAWRRTNGASH